MAPPVNKQVVVKVLQVTKTTALVGVAVSLVMKVFQPVKRWRLRKIPGTTFKPIVGDALQFLRSGDLLKFVHGMCVKYSDKPLFKYWVLSKPYLVVNDPKLAWEMMTIADRPSSRLPVRWAQESDHAPLRDMLPFINGDRWARGRRAINGAVLHASALSSHLPSMQAAVDRLLEVLDKGAATGKPINVMDCCAAMSLDVIAKAIFDIDLHSDGLVDSQAGVDAVLQSAMAALAVSVKANSSLLTPDQIENGWWDKYPVGSPEFGKRFLSCSVNMVSMPWTQLSFYTCKAFPGLTPVWRFLARVLPDKNARAQTKMMRGTRHGCIKLIDDCKARQQQMPAGAETRQQGLLSSMLSHPSSGNVVDETMSLVYISLLAGNDTTANTLSMGLYYLSRNHEVQKQAQQEVDVHLKGKVPTSKDLKELPYLNAVIKEVLRLASPAAFTDRLLSSDYTPSNGVFRLTAGTAVLMPLHSHHRDPKIWPRPLEFLPERFLPGHEDLAPTDPDMFLVFGGGVRRCPGLKFALLEVRLALARMLQRFEFRPAPGSPEPVMRASFSYAPDEVVLTVTKRAILAALY